MFEQVTRTAADVLRVHGVLVINAHTVSRLAVARPKERFTLIFGDYDYFYRRYGVISVIAAAATVCHELAHIKYPRASEKMISRIEVECAIKVLRQMGIYVSGEDIKDAEDELDDLIFDLREEQEETCSALVLTHVLTYFESVTPGDVKRVLEALGVEYSEVRL